MDFDGNMKEMTSNKNYAIQYLSPTSSFMVVRIEAQGEGGSNEKKYTPLLNENYINANMMSKRSTLDDENKLTENEKT